MRVSDDAIVEAVLRASRVLVSVAARSVTAIDHDVTLHQYRALVMLASRGPQQPSQLAEALGVHPSTITRLCDRLVTKGLVRRRGSAVNRRQVWIALEPKGRRLIDAVTKRRREEIAVIAAHLPNNQRAATVRALHVLGEAATEPTTAA